MAKKGKRDPFDRPSLIEFLKEDASRQAKAHPEEDPRQQRSEAEKAETGRPPDPDCLQRQEAYIEELDFEGYLARKYN